MKSALLVTFLFLTALGCATSKCGLYPAGLEVGVHGSESQGVSKQQPTGGKWRQDRERWDNDDTTVGGHATMHFAFTGRCAGE